MTSFRKMEFRKLHDINIITLNVLPWFHVYGLMLLINMTISGSSMVTMSHYKVESLLRAIEVDIQNNFDFFY